MITGTAYFYSFEAAVIYYQPYEPHLSREGLERLVKRKIEEGLIHIGRPPKKKQERVFLNDEEGRWFTEELPG